MIPSAPADDSEKLTILLDALSGAGDFRLRLQAMRSLKSSADVPRVRSALLEQWARSTDTMRAAILDALEAGIPRSRDSDEIKRWSDAEPSPSLQRRLEAILASDVN
jgi:hypothetical protein